MQRPREKLLRRIQESYVHKTKSLLQNLRCSLRQMIASGSSSTGVIAFMTCNRRRTKRQATHLPDSGTLVRDPQLRQPKCLREQAKDHLQVVHFEPVFLQDPLSNAQLFWLAKHWGRQTKIAMLHLVRDHLTQTSGLPLVPGNRPEKVPRPSGVEEATAPIKSIGLLVDHRITRPH